MSIPDPIRTLTRQYVVREDMALTLSLELMDMLQWKKGDTVSYAVNIKDGSLLVSKVTPQNGSKAN